MENYKDKVYTFPEGFELKGMTDEEFEKWAEKVAERHNRIVELCEVSDFNTLTAEMGGLDNHFTPLMIVMMLFGSQNYSKKVTKEEVMAKYAYMKDPKYLSEMNDKFIKELKALMNNDTQEESKEE